jgi:hypothetical protein
MKELDAQLRERRRVSDATFPLSSPINILLNRGKGKSERIGNGKLYMEEAVNNHDLAVFLAAENEMFLSARVT